MRPLAERAPRALARGALLVAALLAASGALAGCSDSPGRAGERATLDVQPLAEREFDRGDPNVVVIMADDQSLNSLRRSVMPRTLRLLGDRGTRFRRGVAAPPICCPSRAGVLTGQYPHNHGVVRNDYELLRAPEQTLPVWLARDGYRTGMIGKYLNRYEDVAGLEPAPGFDFWHVVGEPAYYDYEASHNGERRRYGSRPRDYSTRMLTRKAGGFVRKASRDGNPFFLWLSYVAPHTHNEPHPDCAGRQAPKPAPGDFAAFADVPLPRDASFNEADVSDKPPKSRVTRLLSPRAIDRLTHRYRCVAATMREVDRGVAAMMRTLRETGEARRTVVVYVSDNGTFLGEHRIPGRKGPPYTQIHEVPMLGRFPAGALGARPEAAVAEPVSNVDLAPTVLELAGAEPCAAEGSCRSIDGRSFAGLLRGERSGWPADRALLLERGRGCGAYRALRSRRYLHIAYPQRGSDGCAEVAERELYDLRRDPRQLENLLATAASRRRHRDLARRLEGRLLELAECAGTSGQGACG